MGSILNSQTDLPTLKNPDFTSTGARFSKNHHFDPKMVLNAFWGSLGLLLGALGALLGVSWELLRASGSTKEGLQIRLGTLLALFCLLLAAEDGPENVLGWFGGRFSCSRGSFRRCSGTRPTDFGIQN